MGFSFLLLPEETILRKIDFLRFEGIEEMNKILLLTLLSGLFLLSSGCSKYWYQEGTTFQQCQQARSECFEELSKRTDFSGFTSEYELNYMEECMQSKGYRKVSAKELPMDVKRQEPDRSLHWMSSGVAGKVEP